MRNKRLVRSLLSTSAILVEMLAIGVAQAQSAPAPTTALSAFMSAPGDSATPSDTAPPSNRTAVATSDTAVGEIIVTALKREERLNDVPMSINAATGAQLAKLGVADVSQLVKIVPGFTFQLSNSGLPIYGIRGISFFDNSAIANPAVSVYVNQVPLPFSVLTPGATLDLQRVEVLKGPQGTLFGQNATGGAVNYIPARPTQEFSAGGNLTYGRFDAVNADAFVSGPLSDTLSLRLAGRTDQRGNWQYSTTRDDGNGKRNFNAARLLVDWQPTSALRFEINLNAWWDKSQTQAAQFIRYAPTVPVGGYAPAVAALSTYGPVPTTARAADWDPDFDLAHDDKFKQAALSATLDLGPNVTLTSITSYIDFDQFSPSDPDGTNYADITGDTVGKVKAFNQELRLAGSTGPLKWMVGGNYEHQSLSEQIRAGVAGTNAQIGPVVTTGLAEDNRQKVDTKAVFGSLDFEVGGGITLQGSARYTDQNRDFRGCTRDDGSGTTASYFNFLSLFLSGTPGTAGINDCVTLDAVTFKSVDILTSSLDQNNFSWRVGANWKMSPTTLVYANVTKGYKAGGFTTIPLVFSSQSTRVDQESVLAYEAGFKAGVDGWAQLNGSAFYYDYRNKQTTGYVPTFLGNFPALVNVPKSRVIGAELSLDARPVDALRLNLSATYIDTKVQRSFLTASPLGTVIDVEGERLPNTPKVQLTADAEYNFPLGGDVSGYIGATGSYRSSANASFGEAPELNLPGYGLLDLRAGIQGPDDRWRAQLWVRNVTDKYYLVNAGRTIDTASRFAGLPRTYGLTVGFSY